MTNQYMFICIFLEWNIYDTCNDTTGVSLVMGKILCNEDCNGDGFLKVGSFKGGPFLSYFTGVGQIPTPNSAAP